MLIAQLEVTAYKPQTTVARERQRSAETVLITIFSAKSAQKQGHKNKQAAEIQQLASKFGVQDEDVVLIFADI